MDINTIFSRIPNLTRSENLVVVLAAGICLTFGLACIALVTAPADNVWYFYGKYLLSGQRLYSDLHLIQQPLFVAINAIGMVLFGDTYVGQKLIFVFVLFGYVYASYRLVCEIDASPVVKAIVLLSFFMCAIHFEAYRFDDYHAFEGLLSLALALTLLPLKSATWQQLLQACFSGGLIGLAILTRVNDGLALLLAAMLIQLIRDTPRLALQIAALILSTVVTLCGVLALIRETPLTWLHSTILDAIGAKGGSNVFIAPVALIKNSANYLLHEVGSNGWRLLAILFIVSLTYYLLRKTKYLHANRVTSTLMTVVVVGLAISNRRVDLNIVTAALVFLIVTAFATWRLTQWIGRCAPTTVNRESLLLIPLSLYGAGAMSSGGYHYGLYYPMALTLLMSSLCVERKYWGSASGAVVLVVAGYMAASGFIYRLDNPYSWHSYRVAPLMVKRTLVMTEGIGYVPMDAKMQDFILPICNEIKDAKAELLSLPFPYANYICGKWPWHGYVQTFFDTSNALTIQQLITDLQNRPPQFILYQQQLDNLRRHEEVFNNGNPLPHRKLDAFIIGRVESKDWRIVRQQHFGGDSDWLLIDTSRSDL